MESKLLLHLYQFLCRFRLINLVSNKVISYRSIWNLRFLIKKSSSVTAQSFIGLTFIGVGGLRDKSCLNVNKSFSSSLKSQTIIKEIEIINRKDHLIGNWKKLCWIISNKTQIESSFESILTVSIQASTYVSGIVCLELSLGMETKNDAITWIKILYKRINKTYQLVFERWDKN